MLTVRTDIFLHLPGFAELKSSPIPSILQCALLLCIYAVARFLLGAVLSRRKNSVKKARTVLQALLAVLTPTQSIWPPGYASLVFRATQRARADQVIIRLDLGIIYHDLLSNKVELRNPESHLPSLVSNALSVASCVSLRLDVGLDWWFKLLVWIISCELLPKFDPVCVVTPAVSNKSASALSVIDTIVSEPTLSSRHFLRSLHDGIPSIALDCVPRRHLEACIRNLQATMLPGTYLVLGLTTRAGAVTQSFWSKSTVVTALSLLPRTSQRLRHRKQQGRTPARRTTTSLFTSAANVLQLLTSGPMPLRVEVVRNMSAEYAAFLHRNSKDLEDHPKVRQAFVDQWGMQAWFEERLCTAWEAALVDVGMLESWAIVVRKTE